MNFPVSISNAWQHVPPEAKFFLKRAFFIFIAWKLLYHLLLFPMHFPDRELNHLSAASAGFLYRYIVGDNSVWYKEEFKEGSYGQVLYINNTPALGIGIPCNGLEIYILFIAFLFCIPTTYKRQASFALGGIAVIFIINSFRCFGLSWLVIHHYSWFNFAHHYLFQIISYSIIFLLWIWYTKKSHRYAH